MVGSVSPVSESLLAFVTIEPLVAALGTTVLDRVLSLLETYGLPVVFLFAFAETSLLFPFLPSEAVVPAAAAVLVSDPLSALAFTVVSTLGATTGSAFCYFVFGTGGARLVSRFGRYVRVTEKEIERADRWFHRWGESSVLWGRLLPVARSLISIPAGFAAMDFAKFVAYSAIGSALFSGAVAALVLFGFDGRPYAVLADSLGPVVTTVLDFARASPVLAAVTLLLASLVFVAFGRRCVDRLDSR